MIWSSFVLSLYCARKSVAPENAIWLIYSSTSSAVMPSPLSMNFRVFSSGFTRTCTCGLYFSGSVYSPIISSFFSLVIASHPLEISSRKKISWSEYNHFLIIGKILSLLMESDPCFSLILYTAFLSNYFITMYYNPTLSKSQGFFSTHQSWVLAVKSARIFCCFCTVPML